MATTTEPPWSNYAEGTAARNGSTSHTVSFGFTAGTGTLLVLIMAGAVTHTISAGGWTERQQPVNSAELSLFTATGAGQTGFTVVHNGSDYAVRWVCYEFPSGSTYTNSSSATANNSTFPALGSLPGTAQVVVAAIGMMYTAFADTPVSTASWTNPWVEDDDTQVPRDVTDGVYLTVGHRLNVTTTTITPPTLSFTGTGTGSLATDRQKVVIAVNAAATGGGTGYTGTPTDPVGITDATTKAVGRAQPDPVGISDTATRTVDGSRTPADPVAVTDSSTGVTDAARAAADPVGVSDSVSAVLSGDKTAAPVDPVGITDATTSTTASSRATADQVGITDTVTADRGRAVTIGDTVGVTDTDDPITFDIGESRDDPVGIADATARTVAGRRTTADPVAISDTVTATVAGSGERIITDPVGITDTPARTVAAVRAPSDQVAVSDTVNAQLTSAQAQTKADPVTINDTVTAYRTTIGGPTRDIHITGVTEPTSGWQTTELTAGWAGTDPTTPWGTTEPAALWTWTEPAALQTWTTTEPATATTVTEPALAYATTEPAIEGGGVPLTMRADSTEYATATVSADHDITAATVEVALPTTNTAPSVWYDAEVLGVTQVGQRWQVTYRILLGPAAGVTSLGAGTYDWTVRITDTPGPEVPVRKVGTVTITTT